MRKARADGITHCPGYTDETGTAYPCGVVLDYDTPGLPTSAEADHIVQPRHTGGVPDDSVGNLRVLCRRCNHARERTRQPVPVAGVDEFPLLRRW